MSLYSASREMTEQITLPGLFFVRNPGRLSGIKEWRAEGFSIGGDTFPLRLKQVGTPAPEVLVSLLKAYPYVRRVTVATMHLDSSNSPIRYKDIVVRHVTPQRLKNKAASTRRVEGWNRDFTSMGLLSRVRLRRKELAHIPMMRFWGNDPAKIGNDIFSEFPGFIFDDGVEDGKPVHYFWGATIMPLDRWERFLSRCEVVPSVDYDFIKRSRRDGTSVVRLFATKRKPIDPQVVAMSLPKM